MLHLPISKEYIDSLYIDDYKAMETANNTILQLKELGLAAPDMVERLQSFSDVYEAKMAEIGALCINQFSSALKRLIGKSYTHCFPRLQDNKIPIIVYGTGVQLRLFMDITSGEIVQDVIPVSVTSPNDEYVIPLITKELERLNNTSKTQTA